MSYLQMRRKGIDGRGAEDRKYMVGPHGILLVYLFECSECGST